MDTELRTLRRRIADAQPDARGRRRYGEHVPKNLTMNYKKAIYMVTPSAENNELRGKKCTIHEWEDGLVELWHGGRRLPYSVFNREGHVQQAEVVGNKRLAVVLEQIRDKQVVRDQQRLASPKVTLREKRLLRQAAARATEMPSTA